MKPDQRLDALLRAARESEPVAHDYAFETRLLARLREERRGSWLAWGWRLSPFFAALAVASAVWCRATTDLEADPAALLDAVQGGQSAMFAWLTEEAR